MDIPITDTHQHFICNDKWPYSWAEGIPALAGQRFGPEEYQSASAGTGITKTIFMETSPDDPHFHEETRFVRELSEQPGSTIAGIIANCRPEEEHGFADFIDSIRTGRRPRADIEEGVRSVALVHLGNIALRLGRSLRFDPAAERVIDDDEANGLLSRTYRPGHWAIPKAV